MEPLPWLICRHDRHVRHDDGVWMTVMTKMTYVFQFVGKNEPCRWHCPACPMLIFGPERNLVSKKKSSSSRKLAMNSITDTSVDLIVRSGGWRRRLFTFALIGASIVVTFLLVTTFYSGESFIDRLGKAYAAVWEPTTQ